MSTQHDKNKKRPESFDSSFHVPADETEWKQLVLNGKLSRKTIHDILHMESGSHVRKRQFIMFRVLWKKRRTHSSMEHQLGLYGLDACFPTAGDILKRSDEFQKYLAIVAGEFYMDGIDEHHDMWAGVWMLVARYQSNCLGPNDPNDLNSDVVRNFEGEDEVDNSTALLLFLDSIEMLIRHHTTTWTMKRARFKARFRGPAEFATITDGALWIRVQRRILGLVEVKRARRMHPEEEEIQKQMSAEFVGWEIKCQSRNPCCSPRPWRIEVDTVHYYHDSIKTPS